ncbi:MAG: hypothetical protein ACRDG4_00565, partial [Chloroflexota bacterium]
MRPAWALQALDSAGSPTLTAVPDAGRPLTPILLTGRGYPPGATVDFTFNELPGAPPQVLAGAVAGPDGSLPPQQLTIPAGAAQGGVGLISALWAASPNAATQATGAVSIPFAVTPADRGLSVTPGAAGAGTTAVVNGTGFEPNTPVRIQLTDASGTAVSVLSGASSTSTGALLTIGLTIPLTATTGLGVINASDNAGNLAGTPIVILPPVMSGQSIPSLTLTPTRAVAGEVVHFTAGGFPPRALVSLALSDATGNQATQSFGTLPTTDGTGQVQGAFTVPSSQALTGGSGNIGFTPANGFTLGGNGGTLLGVTLQTQPGGSSGGVTASAPLVIAGPRLAIFPPVGTPGQSYTVIGTGFGADEQVTVAQTDAAGVITQLGMVQASDGGVFSLFGTYPPLPAGAPGTAGATFSIMATGEPSGLVAGAVLSVHAAPSIALTPYVVAPGQPVLVSGAAFPANSTVTMQVALPGLGVGRESILTAVTDGRGAFTLPFTVPLTAPLGPLIVQVSAPSGTAVSGVLTVNDRSASVRASPLAVKLGQSLTVQGQGFASGETIDLFLAQGVAPTYVAAGAGGFDRQAPPLSGQPEALPGTLRTITADALGSFAASYSLTLSGVSLPNSAYLIGVRGETSGRLAVTAFGIAGASSSPIGPSPPASICKGRPSTALGIAGGSVQYLVTPMAATVTGKGTTTTLRSQLLLVNTGDQPAMITVAYLLDMAGAKGKSALLPASAGTRISVHTVTFEVAAHAVATRDVQADSGTGTVVGIIVRAQAVTQVLDANGCPASPLTPLPAAGTPQIHTVLITNRTRTPLKGHGTPKADAIVTNAISQESTGATAGGPATHWYFAGGGAGGAYAEDLSLFNPQQDPAHVRIRALSAKGLAGTVQTVTLAPFGQGIVRVRPPSCVKGKTDCAAELGVVVQSTMPIVAARGLAWGVPRAEQSTAATWMAGAG